MKKKLTRNTRKHFLLMLSGKWMCMAHSHVGCAENEIILILLYNYVHFFVLKNILMFAPQGIEPRKWWNQRMAYRRKPWRVVVHYTRYEIIVVFKCWQTTTNLHKIYKNKSDLLCWHSQLLFMILSDVHLYIYIFLTSSNILELDAVMGEDGKNERKVKREDESI